MSEPKRTLTRRENEVVSLLCEEMSYKAIAHQLGIARGTVKRHAAIARLKMGVNTNIGLALAFTEQMSHTRNSNQ